MNYFEWINERIKKMNVWDIGALKTCIFAFALLVAKFWPAILSLKWQWYAGIFFLTYIYLIYKIYIKK